MIKPIFGHLLDFSNDFAHEEVQRRVLTAELGIHCMVILAGVGRSSSPSRHCIIHRPERWMEAWSRSGRTMNVVPRKVNDNIMNLRLKRVWFAD